MHKHMIIKKFHTELQTFNGMVFLTPSICIVNDSDLVGVSATFLIFGISFYIEK